MEREAGELSRWKWHREAMRENIVYEPRGLPDVIGRSFTLSRWFLFSSLETGIFSWWHLHDCRWNILAVLLRCKFMETASLAKWCQLHHLKRRDGPTATESVTWSLKTQVLIATKFTPAEIKSQSPNEITIRANKEKDFNRKKEQAWWWWRYLLLLFL